MNNVNDRYRLLTIPTPPARKPSSWQTVGAKVKRFSESAKSNGVFSSDFEGSGVLPAFPEKKSSDALAGKSLSPSINRSWIAFAVTKVLLFSLHPNPKTGFSIEFTEETRRKGKSPRKKELKKGRNI